MIHEPPAKILVNLGPAGRVPLGEGRQFDIDDHSIAVFRTRDGAVFATQAACPHRAGPLADGIVGARTIVCPLHAYGFNLENGQPENASCAALKTYRAAINEDEEIVIEVG